MLSANRIIVDFGPSAVSFMIYVNKEEAEAEYRGTPETRSKDLHHQKRHKYNVKVNQHAKYVG